MIVVSESEQMAITIAQLRTMRGRVTPGDRATYRRLARWWELEARRGYSSSVDSLRYAANMRWAAEIAGQHGPGTWPELTAKAAGAQ